RLLPQPMIVRMQIAAVANPNPKDNFWRIELWSSGIGHSLSLAEAPVRLPPASLTVNGFVRNPSEFQPIPVAGIHRQFGKRPGHGDRGNGRIACSGKHTPANGPTRGDAR